MLKCVLLRCDVNEHTRNPITERLQQRCCVAHNELGGSTRTVTRELGEDWRSRTPEGEEEDEEEEEKEEYKRWALAAVQHF